MLLENFHDALMVECMYQRWREVVMQPDTTAIRNLFLDRMTALVGRAA